MPKSKVRKKNDFTINPVSRTPVKVKAGPSSTWFVVLFVGLMLIGMGLYRLNWWQGGFDIAHYRKIAFILIPLGWAVGSLLGWRFHANQTVELQPDGSVLVRFAASGMLELSWHLFTWGDKLEVLEPKVLRDTMVEQLQLALSRHATPTKSGVVTA